MVSLSQSGAPQSFTASLIPGAVPEQDTLPGITPVSVASAIQVAPNTLAPTATATINDVANSVLPVATATASAAPASNAHISIRIDPSLPPSPGMLYAHTPGTHQSKSSSDDPTASAQTGRTVGAPTPHPYAAPSPVGAKSDSGSISKACRSDLLSHIDDGDAIKQDVIGELIGACMTYFASLDFVPANLDALKDDAEKQKCIRQILEKKVGVVSENELLRAMEKINTGIWGIFKNLETTRQTAERHKAQREAAATEEATEKAADEAQMKATVETTATHCCCSTCCGCTIL